jgi:hypothetical protein
MPRRQSELSPLHTDLYSEIPGLNLSVTPKIVNIILV